MQSPDGTFLYDIPTPQLLREMQPDAKFIITLTDPVRRSEYAHLVADLAGAPRVTSAHLAEALGYRLLDRAAVGA